MFFKRNITKFRQNKNLEVRVCFSKLVIYVELRYFVPQVPITGKMLNGYFIFSVKNIVQNVKLIELSGENLAPLHFVIFKS